MWKRKFLLITVTVLGAYGGLALSRQVPAGYTAESRLLVGSGPVSTDGAESLLPGDWIINTEIDVLRSRAFAEAALARVEMPSSFADPFFLEGPFGQLGDLLRTGDEIEVDPLSLQAAQLDRIRQALVIQPGDDSFVLLFQHTSTDPAFSSAFLNALMDVYMERKAARAADAKAELQDVLMARRTQLDAQISAITELYQKALDRPNNDARVQFIEQRLNGVVRLNKLLLLEQERINSMPSDAGVRLVSSAVVPRGPSTSKTIYIILVAVLATAGTMTLILVNASRRSALAARSP